MSLIADYLKFCAVADVLLVSLCWLICYPRRFEEVAYSTCFAVASSGLGYLALSLLMVDEIGEDNEQFHWQVIGGLASLIFSVCWLGMLSEQQSMGCWWYSLSVDCRAVVSFLGVPALAVLYYYSAGTACEYVLSLLPRAAPIEWHQVPYT